jgi:hypothetical protein
MSESYYQRGKILHLDGTNIFQTEDDRKTEQEISAYLSEVWECSVRPFGALCPVDWYAERYGRLIGVLELKSRPHDFAKYSTVFLNVRKWLALNLAAIGLGCPAVFIIRFNDGIYWCRISDIDARVNRIAGCTELVKSHNDIEPVVEVRNEILKEVRCAPKAEKLT